MPYKVNVELDYPASPADLEAAIAGKPHKRKRPEVGSVVDDIPEQSIPWLLADGSIEEVRSGKVRK